MATLRYDESGIKYNTVIDAVGEMEEQISKLNDNIKSMDNSIKQNTDDIENIDNIAKKNMDDIEDVNERLLKDEEEAIKRDKELKAYITLVGGKERYKIMATLYNITYTSFLVAYILLLVFVPEVRHSIVFHILMVYEIVANFIACLSFGLKSEDLTNRINKL
jgi:hypothetical protein